MAFGSNKTGCMFHLVPAESIKYFQYGFKNIFDDLEPFLTNTEKSCLISY